MCHSHKANANTRKLRKVDTSPEIGVRRMNRIEAKGVNEEEKDYDNFVFEFLMLKLKSQKCTTF